MMVELYGWGQAELNALWQAGLGGLRQAGVVGWLGAAGGDDGGTKSTTVG